ncbi:MAG: 30S ribosome-binding factor RbfA [Propionibacteriaceae bacterium]|jgi:ribosome-binding factor A|nr:30S ribosome-binding factor RbfA [Propionibacteriaceae bacterium]
MRARTAEQIKVIVAEMLERRIKDPRLGFVTVTDVRMSGDGREASLFYTVLGDDQAREDTAVALASATGLLRSTVGKRLGLKFAPVLTFIPDALADDAAGIEEALAAARARDAEIAALAEGARFAGEADPYKHDDDDS